MKLLFMLLWWGKLEQKTKKCLLTTCKPLMHKKIKIIMWTMNRQLVAAIQLLCSLHILASPVCWAWVTSEAGG